MVKLIVYALALFGTFAVITAWMPSAWSQGFMIKGQLIPWGACLCLGSMAAVYTLKAK